MLILCSSALPFDGDKIADAEKYYQQALVFYEHGNLDSAIQKLKTALKFNWKMAKAHHQLALVYMDEETVNGRFKATFEIERALRMDSKNEKFRFTEAVLNLKKGMTFNAERQFKKILENDPFNYEACRHLAMMKEEEMLHYQDMISVEPNSDGIIYMQKFALKLKEEAAEYYKKAIAVKPELTDVYYRLALIYYEFGNFDEMIQLLESSVKINPMDKNCHLFLGFAYHNAQKYDLALEQYKIAGYLMDGHEKEAMESIEFILSPEELKEFHESASEEKELLKEKFWKRNDPFYLSETNERKMEHYSRIAYSNLRFSRTKDNIAGWATDMGKVYTRFGKPKQRYRTRPYIGEMVGNGRNPLVHSKEVWIYPGFEFRFEDEYLSGNYNFARHVKPEYDYKQIYTDMIKHQPQYYEMFADSLVFNAPHEIIAFRGDSNQTELEFACCIPVREILPTGSELQSYTLRKGIFLFDKDWENQFSKTSDLILNAQSQVEIGDEKYFTFVDKATVPPGQYNYAIELMDDISEKRSAIHSKMIADTFAVNQFYISDILFAREIQPPYSSKDINRSDFKILPNPMRLYKQNQPIALYFEIYNLTQNSFGETRYKVEYKVGVDFDSQPAWKRLLTKMKILKKRGEVTSSYLYSGENSNELVYQNILLNQNLLGRIKITIIATDLNSGLIAEKKEIVSIIE